jgi:predicted metal-dependent phosphoesterase TrpH
MYGLLNLSPVSELTAAQLASPSAGRSSIARVDLHCHSTFSQERIKYLPRVVYQPLLTPGEVYDLAKRRGMSFVTITDHDTIDGCMSLLNERGALTDFIVGEEVSVRFPEDGTVIHVNVFDHDEAQHREIQRARHNIHDFVDYVRRIDKLYVLNHLTWTAQHRVLTPRQLELLLHLFPVFEGLNGARSYAHNSFACMAAQGHPTTLVAGSDSHTNRVGTTHTISEGETAAALLGNVRRGIALMAGAFGTPEKLREDVRLILQKNIERRLEDAHGQWQRMLTQVVGRVGRLIYPVVCLGYHKRQDKLIRGYIRSLDELHFSGSISAAALVTA